MQDSCEKDLAEAMPALESALKALDSLKKSDITEVNSMKNPPGAVILTSEALCYMFAITPQKVKAPDGKGKVNDFWGAAKKQLWSDSNLIENMKGFDKDNMSEKLIEQITPFKTNPDFAPDVVKKGSVAAAGIAQWVHAMIIYDKVAKEVGPKKEQLAQAQSELAEAMGLLASKQAELKAVIDKVAQLEADFESSVKKQQDLEFKSEQCKNRLARAETLISNLGGEQDRWSVASQKLGVSYDNLTGDVLVP